MSSNQRIFAHYRSLKWAGPEPGTKAQPTSDTCLLGGCSECMPSPKTPNWVWELLAKTHKRSVREIKDLITQMRKEKAEANG